eukprot:Opistho-2@58477
MAPTAEVECVSGVAAPAAAAEANLRAMPFATDSDKAAWVAAMRLRFCAQKEFPETANMVLADGSLNREYFRTRIAKQKERKWTDVERRLLLEGIAKHGIGHFGDIAADTLSEWSAHDLRLKTQKLMGRQNLALYKGWKGDEAAVLAEYERNKEIGMRLSCWKSGYLVADEAGLVERELARIHGVHEGDRDAKRARTE